MSRLPELILASTSVYRRALLERLGVPFRCEPPGVDEDAWKSRGLSPRELVETLADLKARAVLARFPDAVVIGSDQTAVLDGEIVGKPGTPERARSRLRSLSGRSHVLLTALAVVRGSEIRTHTDATELRLRELSDEEIARYVAVENPIDCAGGYKIEAAGISLFESIDTRDPSAIVGLPLIALSKCLRAFGYQAP